MEVFRLGKVEKWLRTHLRLTCSIVTIAILWWGVANKNLLRASSEKTPIASISCSTSYEWCQDKGIRALYSGFFAKAISYLDAAEALSDPDLAQPGWDLFFSRARAYERLPGYEIEAINDYDQAIAQNSDLAVYGLFMDIDQKATILSSILLQIEL